MGNSKVMGSAMVVAGDQMSLPLSIFKVWDYFDGEGNGNPLQYPCLGKPMDGEAWKATVRGVAKSRTRLSNSLSLSLSLDGTDSMTSLTFPGNRGEFTDH